MTTAAQYIYPATPTPNLRLAKRCLPTVQLWIYRFQQGAMDDSGKADEWGFTPHPGWDGTLVSNALGQLVGIIGTNQEQDLASCLYDG